MHQDKNCHNFKSASETFKFHEKNALRTSESKNITKPNQTKAFIETFKNPEHSFSFFILCMYYCMYVLFYVCIILFMYYFMYDLFYVCIILYMYYFIYVLCIHYK